MSRFNQPINEFHPSLNKLGQSKLAKFIICHGWYISPEMLNKKPHDIKRDIELREFEGLRRDFAYNLLPGIYHGEMLDGKMDGYGILYCTDEALNVWLYECSWKGGSPIEGRYIRIIDGKISRFIGPLDENYLLTGHGKMYNRRGDSYEGLCKNGKKNGLGQLTFADGSNILGTWLDDNAHGEGRYTAVNGDYQEGVWDNGQLIGEHKHYDKQGNLL